MLGRIVGKTSSGQSGGGQSGGESGSQATYLVIDGNEVIFRSPHYGAAWAFRRGLGDDRATIAKAVSIPRDLPSLARPS
jgi:hypothetical protein